MLASLAALACLGAAPLEQALYPGRFGDIVMTPAAEKAQAASLYLVQQGKAAGRAAATAADSVAETSVAPLVAHMAGVLPTAFPAPLPAAAADFMRPASGVLVLTVNGLSADDLATRMPKTAHALGAARKVALRPAFAPRDRVAAAISRLTGTTPADHGIPAKAWLNATSGAIVEAFSEGVDAAASRVASVADVVGQTARGKGLLVSLSSDRQMASAASVHPTIARGAGASWPAATVVVDAATRTAVAASTTGSLPAALLKVSRAEAEAALARVAADELAAMDAESEAHGALVGELGSALVVLDRLKKEAAARGVTADDAADLIFVTVAGAEVLSGSAPAIALVDAALPAVIRKFQEGWGDRAAAAVILPGGEDAEAVTAPAAFEGWRQVGAHLFRVPSAAGAMAADKACAAARALAAPARLTVHCLGEEDRPGRRLQEGEVKYSMADLHLYQVTLWTTILITVTMLVGSCALYNMEITHDSLLFSKEKAD